MIDHDGLHSTNDKVRAIQLAPAPSNVRELKSFLGLVNYYGKFLPDLSTHLASLHLLLRKQVSRNWGPSQDLAFLLIKKMLHFSLVLVHYDPKLELILSTDASPFGVGVVLSRPSSDGSDQPIAYASRTLSNAEKNYSQLDKEGLAVIFE